MQGAQTPLRGVKIVEAASFVAGPSGGMCLAQLGAEVIRVDPPGGGADHDRWPVDPEGHSYYWASLNKGKRSVAIDARTPAGRELLIALATAPGPDSGILLDNAAGRRRPRYEELAEQRSDVIHLHVQGFHDGRPAVDYTVNAGIGLPDMTGPEVLGAPVNQVLPAWDLLAGMTAATGVLAALHQRRTTGQGAKLELALNDVALSAVGGLGWFAEVELAGAPRPRQGNHIYGSFGLDLSTADGTRVMVAALTAGQWSALCDATDSVEVFAALEGALGVDLREEGARYHWRDAIAGILSPWFAARTHEEVAAALDDARVLWGPFRTMDQALRDAQATEASVVTRLHQPGIGDMAATANPLRWDERLVPPTPAPRLGEDTDEVLTSVLGLSDTELGRLHDEHVIASAER